MVRICTGLVCVRSTLMAPLGPASRGALHVEGVVLLARGVLGRDVELGEIVVVGLDVRPFGDGEAHVGEDLDHLVEHLADGVDAPVLQRPGAHGQRHVGLLAGEAGRERAALQLGLAAFQRLADARLEAVDRLPEGLALVARQGAQRRHQLRDAPLLAERGDAHALDRREIGGSRDLGGERALEGGEIGGLCHPLSSRRHPRAGGIHVIGAQSCGDHWNSRSDLAASAAALCECTGYPLRANAPG